MSTHLVAAPRARSVGLTGVLALVFVLVLVLALAGLAGCSDEPLPEYGEVPAFALTDQLGRPFTDADLRGKITVVDFVFTSCPTICPMLSHELAQIAERYADEPSVQLLSISIDPAHDTPEVLREYARSYGADADRWRFVTGDAGAVERVVVDGFHQALGQPTPRDDGRYDILHSSRFVLLDRGGRIRGYYRNDGDGREALVRAIDQLK